MELVYSTSNEDDKPQMLLRHTRHESYRKMPLTRHWIGGKRGGGGLEVEEGRPLAKFLDKSKTRADIEVKLMAAYPISI